MLYLFCSSEPVTRLDQARNQLGTLGERRVFLEGPKFFKLCAIVLNNVQHIFAGDRNFL